MLTKENIVAYLQKCHGSELSDILQQVFAERVEIQTTDEGFQYRMVLGLAACENKDGSSNNVEYKDWQIALIAYADTNVYSAEFSGEPFCQYGKCEHCNLELCSHVKNALCPTCFRKVILT